MNVREWALPVYTILIQLGAGMLLVLWLVRGAAVRRLGGAEIDRVFIRPVMVVFFTLLAGALGAHFHLSNPALSFLAVLNFGHSWLSREVVFTVLALLSCAALVDQFTRGERANPALKTGLGWVTIGAGFLAIYCMSQIYLLPTQAPWNHWTTVFLFLASALLMGIPSAAALLTMEMIFTNQSGPPLSGAHLAVLRRSFVWLARLAGVVFGLVGLLSLAQILSTTQGSGLAQVSASLLLDLYQPLLWLRFIVLLVGITIFSLVAYWLDANRRDLQSLVAPVYLACLLVLMGEILGRFLFYATHVRLGI
ncbi:MAG: dimethyl sulfoxide reductase anchor subunit family protein [Chloroflexota bacterium]